MRHPRTWSAVARSLTVVSSSDCSYTCMKCFQKINSQNPWSANAYKEAHNGLYTEVPQAWWDYLRRYTSTSIQQSCEPCNIHRGATVPTDSRVVLQFKAACFRMRGRHYYDGRLQTCAIPSTHSPLDGRNLLRSQLVYQTAVAEASGHHHGCLCHRSMH